MGVPGDTDERPWGQRAALCSGGRGRGRGRLGLSMAGVEEEGLDMRLSGALSRDVAFTQPFGG